MRLIIRAVAVVGGIYAAVLGASAWWAKASVRAPSCPAAASIILVDSGSHTLCLCRNGRSEGQFRIALGRGGVGKHAAGDGKTPIGSYDLGPARPSSRFKTFIPIGYPTAQQAKLGFTGSDVGVHGPHRAFRWLGHATVSLDWTAGCIAAGTDDDLQTIAEWVASVRATRITIA
jgi:murein L,D-transpeptidase YafK